MSEDRRLPDRRRAHHAGFRLRAGHVAASAATSVEVVRFVCFSADNLAVYEALLADKA
jgi:hypothetical protein